MCRWQNINVLWLVLACCACRAVSVTPTSQVKTIDLPAPRQASEWSLEETLVNRRSVRVYSEASLTWAEIGQLLWAAQGITRDWGARTAPSAGALYPLEIYILTAEGLYHYVPQNHQVIALVDRDLRQALWEVSIKQDAIREAPAVFVIAAVYARTAGKYGERAERYVHLEAGHSAQNLLLQAVALGLGGVPIGAFYDDQVKDTLGLI